jgi:hypothetical protein
LDDGRWEVSVTPPDVLGPKPTVTVVLTGGQFNRYRQWKANQLMIHEALPELSDSDREKLQTGLGDEEFDKLAEDIPEGTEEWFKKAVFVEPKTRKGKDDE